MKNHPSIFFLSPSVLSSSRPSHRKPLSIPQPHRPYSRNTRSGHQARQYSQFCSTRQKAQRLTPSISKQTMKEKDLLSSFLVGNELHDSITFTKFTSYFPPAYRSSPEVKDLYRAFMNSRHQIRTRVRRNIEIEARRNPFHTSSEQEPQQQEREKEQDRVMALEGFDELVPEDMDICMEVEVTKPAHRSLLTFFLPLWTFG